MSLKPDFESAYVQVGVLVKNFDSPRKGHGRDPSNFQTPSNESIGSKYEAARAQQGSVDSVSNRIHFYKRYLM